MHAYDIYTYIYIYDFKEIQFWKTYFCHSEIKSFHYLKELSREICDNINKHIYLILCD